MTNLYKNLSLFILFFAMMAPQRGHSNNKMETGEVRPSSMAKIKILLGEKKVDEAIEILKVQYKQVLKSDGDRRDLSRWLSLFLYDDTMTSYEKALGFADTKVDEADAEFKKSLSSEPYNKTLVTHYLSFLISTERFRAAQEFAQSKLLEQPYMGFYKIYSLHAGALLQQKGTAPTCDNREFDEIEQKYCFLVQLILKVSSADSKIPIEAPVLKSLVKKVKLPDAYYWSWKAKGDQEDLKKYVYLCQSLSPKDKRNYKIVPGVCGKVEDALEKLKPKT